MDSIFTLPNELLTQIIQWLPPKLLYSTLPLLDKRFHGVCRDIVVGVRLEVRLRPNVRARWSLRKSVYWQQNLGYAIIVKPANEWYGACHRNPWNDRTIPRRCASSIGSMTGKSNPVRPMIAFEVEFDLHECDADAFLTSLQPSESSGKTPLYEELVKLLHIRHLELFTHNVHICEGYIEHAEVPTAAMATLRKCIENLPHVEHSSVKLGLSACEALPQEKIKDLQLDVYGFRESNLRNLRLFQNLERLMLHQDEPANVLTDWSWTIGPRLNELVLSSSCIIDADDLLSLLGERPNLTILGVEHGIMITHQADVECSLRSLGIVESPSAGLFSSRILSKVVDLQIRVHTIKELQRLSVCRFSPQLQHLTGWLEISASGHNIKSLKILASRIPAADLATLRDAFKEALWMVVPKELLRNITVGETDGVDYNYSDLEENYDEDSYESRDSDYDDDYWESQMFLSSF
ncbi:hypothetical protein SeLEV6574_g00948 [Synchytrium endobioticum]|uniref:F-box domain-containing protein n=1 Tax=Synchytrium endobioticum TaxID=286115 RepID=A0A507DFM5_9FUNG|nr:hypothetical protein SeLEV6574_g00948 [Synchytrium endobioticum]